MIKSLKVIALSILTIALTASCGSDDCTSTDLDEIIVGDWTYNGFNISFDADGTVNDPSNVFEGEINEIQLNDKSYEIMDDNTIVITLSNEDPPASLDFDFGVDDFDCDKISGTQLGLLPFAFTRR